MQRYDENTDEKIVTTMLAQPLLNQTLNLIHSYGEPDQHPIKRMFLTRTAAVGCIAIEAVAVAATALESLWTAGEETVRLASKAIHKIAPKPAGIAAWAAKPTKGATLRRSLADIGRLVVGLASMILIGVVISPEINFRIHMKLNLAVDLLSAKKQRDLENKLKARAAAEAIEKGRAERFAAYEAARRTAKEKQAEEDAIDSHLADLLALRYTQSDSKIGF